MGYVLVSVLLVIEYESCAAGSGASEGGVEACWAGADDEDVKDLGAGSEGHFDVFSGFLSLVLNFTVLRRFRM